MKDPVVIVGGGLGGMTAALALARRGAAVVLLEKQPCLGGYSVAYRRAGYAFDVALHVAAAGDPGQEFCSVIESLGLGANVAFVRLKDAFDVRLGAWRFAMPNDWDRLFDALHAEFPAERGGLLRLRKNLDALNRAYAPLLKSPAGIGPFRHVARFPGLVRRSYLGTDRYLAGFVRDPRLTALLFQAAIFLGVPMADFPAINFIMMFNLLFRRGLYTIAGGGQALTAAMEPALSAAGVRVVTGAEATRVTIRNRAAVAVTTAEGETFPASAVVLAISLPQAVERLIGRPAFPAGYLSHLEALRPSLSAVMVNLGLDGPTSQGGVSSYLTMCYPSPDLDDTIRRQKRSLGLEAFSVTAPDQAWRWPSASDRGTLSLVGGTDAHAWLALSPEPYKVAKQTVAQAALRQLEAQFPGVRPHVAFVDVATPRTFQRFTGNPLGAIMGFECVVGMHRHLLAVGQLPFRRLHAAGAWTPRMGGFMPSMQAGLAAAETVWEELGR